MNGQIELDPSLLASAAVRSERIADAITAAQAVLRQTLDGNGKPWGDDKFGGRFADGAQGYRSARDSLLAGMADMAGTFEQIYRGQLDAARTFGATERGAARELSAAH